MVLAKDLGVGENPGVAGAGGGNEHKGNEGLAGGGARARCHVDVAGGGEEGDVLDGGAVPGVRVLCVVQQLEDVRAGQLEEETTGVQLRLEPADKVGSVSRVDVVAGPEDN